MTPRCRVCRCALRPIANSDRLICVACRTVHERGCDTCEGAGRVVRMVSEKVAAASDVRLTLPCPDCWGNPVRIVTEYLVPA